MAARKGKDAPGVVRVDPDRGGGQLDKTALRVLRLVVERCNHVQLRELLLIRQRHIIFFNRRRYIIEGGGDGCDA